MLAAAPAAGGPAELRCSLADARINESSGVAAASWSDDVVFTHNDSGDSARFFAVDARTCATRAVFSVRGATNVDWEDMARGSAADGTPVLWLADIGDNLATRSSVVVYEVAEPGASAAGGTVPVRNRWTLQYPDGPRDAETLLVDPETSRAVLVSKDAAAGRSRAYRVPAAGSGVLEALAPLDVKALGGGAFGRPSWSVTGGATSPDRRAVVLRTYLGAWVWASSPAEPLAAVLARPPEQLEIPLGRQAEAMSFTRSGSGVWITSEGAAAPLHLIPLGTTAAVPPTTTTAPTTPSAAPAVASPDVVSPDVAFPAVAFPDVDDAAPRIRSVALRIVVAAGAVLLVAAAALAVFLRKPTGARRR